MTTKFSYEDHLGKHSIGFNRACPEWCNSDCVTIWSVSDDASQSRWRLNDGTCMESLPEWMAAKFIRFFLASSKTYYRKYGRDSLRNGFWANFLNDNSREYGELIVKTVGNITPEEAF